MFHLLAGVFASIGMMFGGLFGGHASTTPDHMGMGSTSPMHHMSSTTPWQNGQNGQNGDHGRMGSTTPWKNGSSTPDHMGMMPGIFGKVTAINGDTLTVIGRGSMNTAASTTYTVDATDAKVLKTSASHMIPATTTLSAISVNDTVMVDGTVSGTDVTAKVIIDGVMMAMMEGHGMQGHPPTKS